MKTPESLIEATRMFCNPQKAHDYLTKLRWPEGVIGCPTCGCSENYYLKPQRRWKCKACKRQFSVKVGTVFEDSPIGLDKWLIALWLIVNAKNGISSCELARALSVTQKTAWFMLHRIRLALQAGTVEKLSGRVEADETYIGGKARNMHRSRRNAIGVEKMIGGAGKTIVLGMLERGGKVVTHVIKNPTRKTMVKHLTRHIDGYSALFTDGHRGYDDMGFYFQHQIVDHAVEYVRGNVHTNGMENYWSLLKRTLGGTYVSVEPFHLFRYLDEQAFRFNNRKDSDGERFVSALGGIAGRRLTYFELTGKNLPAAGLGV